MHLLKWPLLASLLFRQVSSQIANDSYLPYQLKRVQNWKFIVDRWMLEQGASHATYSKGKCQINDFKSRPKRCSRIYMYERKLLATAKFTAKSKLLPFRKCISLNDKPNRTLLTRIWLDWSSLPWSIGCRFTFFFKITSFQFRIFVILTMSDSAGVQHYLYVPMHLRKWKGERTCSANNRKHEPSSNAQLAKSNALHTRSESILGAYVWRTTSVESFVWMQQAGISVLLTSHSVVNAHPHYGGRPANELLPLSKDSICFGIMGEAQQGPYTRWAGFFVKNVMWCTNHRIERSVLFLGAEEFHTKLLWLLFTVDSLIFPK